MKFTKNADLDKIFVDYINFERTLLNSIPGGESWDIAESFALAECDCLIMLESAPRANEDPMFLPLEFGVDDIFTAFEQLMANRNKRGVGYPVNYFVFSNLLIMYVGDYEMVKQRFTKYREQTAKYYAEQMYKAYSMENALIEAAHADKANDKNS